MRQFTNNGVKEKKESSQKMCLWIKTTITATTHIIKEGETHHRQRIFVQMKNVSLDCEMH